MSLYDFIYRRFVYPRRVRAYAPNLFDRIKRTRMMLEAPNLKDLIARQLNEMIVHASTTCPFWQRRFSDAGIDPASVNSLDDLQPLPMLEKSEIREDLAGLTSRAISSENLQPDLTGGSTAAPLKFYRDPECVADRVANEWIYLNWYGRTPYDRWGHIWGAQRDIGSASTYKSRLRSKLLDRVIVLPGNQLSPPLIDAYLNRMRQFRPRFLHAYSQAVFFVARHVLAENRVVPEIVATTVTAEPISEQQRETVNKAFRCRTYSIYGTRECGMIAAEAPNSRGMHINPLNALVEFVRPDGSPAEPGTPGQVVVTDLLNRATPLIRYRIGDIGIPISADERGGLGMPRMELAAGRETDFLVTPGHRFIAGAGLTLISEPGIAQLQYVQESLDRVTVRYVKDSCFGEKTLCHLKQQLADVIGHDMEIEFSEVDEIPLLPSGKLQYVRSEVSSDLLRVRPQERAV